MLSRRDQLAISWKYEAPKITFGMVNEVLSLKLQGGQLPSAEQCQMAEYILEIQARYKFADMMIIMSGEP